MYLLKTKACKQGFTLIELLVVIAIISIIAAILFPVFAKAREKARITTGISNMNQMLKGVFMYTSDNEEYPPFGGSGGSITGGGAGVTEWQESIYPYVKNEAAYKDPNDPSGRMSTPNDSNQANGIFTADNAILYSATSFLMNYDVTYPATVSGIATRRTHPLPAYTSPSQFIFFMEGMRHQFGATGGYWGTTLDHTGQYQSIWKVPYALWGSGDINRLFNVSTVTPIFSANGVKIPVPYHDTGEIIGFLDGHVKFYPVDVKNPVGYMKANLPFCHWAYMNNVDGAMQDDGTCTAGKDWNIDND